MRHLRISGSPEQLGHIHGESFRKEIQELYEIREELLESFWEKLTREQKASLLNDQVRALKRYPELYREFQALAKAAHLTEEQLMVVNNYTDMRDYFSSEDEGCSAFYVKNNQGSFAGQTWDMHASATPYVLHLEIEKQDGLKLNIVTVMGCLALAGVSSRTQAVLINNMHCLESDPKGVMWPAVVRLMLEAKSSLEAQNILASNIPSSGHNYLLCEQNNARNIETTGKRWELTTHLSGPEGFTFHTNHYVGKLVDSENLKRRSKTTLARYEALESIFQNRAWREWNFDEAKKSLLIEGAAQTLCIPPNPNNPHAAATCGGIVINLTTQRAEIFKGLYHEGSKNSFSIA